MLDGNSQKEENFNDEFEEIKPSVFRRLFIIFVSMLVIAGLVYISGIYQYFFLSRTPPSTQQVGTESITGEKVILLHIVVFVLRSDGHYGSERTADDVRRLVANASTIWDQADISLRLNGIYILTVDDAEARSFTASPSEFIYSVDEYDRNSINVFLVRTLEGVNGIAFGGLQSVVVADFTTVYDFRVLAHEIGHILGLSHISESSGHLMYRGANGFSLGFGEVMTARGSALRFRQEIQEPMKNQ